MVLLTTKDVLTVNAAEGDLDVTFGTAGKVTTDFPGGDDLLTDSAVQPDGKIIYVGNVTRSGNVIVRYNADGTLDSTFGVNGVVLTDFSPSDFSPRIALLSDGRFLVGGTAASGGDFGITRFTANGSVDTSFGTNGKAVADFGNSDFGYAIALQTDGKILLGGESSSNFALARFNADGSLDNSFDTDGKLTTDFGSFDRILAITIQADGKILAGGASGSQNGPFAIARYNANGSLDSGFGSAGKLTTTFTGGTNGVEALAVRTGGKILAVGTADSFNGNGQFAFAAFNSDGSPDSSFDADGKLTFHVNGGDQAHSLAIQSDGKIVAAGSSSSSWAIARLNTDGSFDTSFDTDGKVTTDFTTSAGYGARAVNVLADGRIVAAGSISSSATSFAADFALVRYNSSGAIDTTFGTNGRVSKDSGFGGSDSISAIAVQQDGFIVALGSNNSNVALARYKPDGTLDESFGVGGKVSIGQLLFGSSSPDKIALQSDGRILVAGRTASFQFALARFNGNGLIDTSFGSGGLAIISSFQEAIAVSVQSNGQILAAGVATGSPDQNFGLAKFNVNGTLDSTFGSAGIVQTDFLGRSDRVEAMTVQADGKIILVGTSAASVNSQVASLARYNEDGQLDLNFGTGGKITNGFGNSSTEFKTVLARTNGKILAGGIAGTKPLIASYNSDGSADASFGTGGSILDTANGQVSSLLLQSGNKILAAIGQFTIARYGLDGNLDTTFGANGRVTTSFFGGSTSVADLAIQADGKILAGGSATRACCTSAATDFALARYQGATLPTVQFNASAASVNEDAGTATITITRTGDTTSPSSVKYATSNGTAIEGKDYVTAVGLINFAAGETSKTFPVLVVDNAYVDGSRTVNLNLSGPSGATVGTPNAAILTIINNDTVTGPNPVDPPRPFVQLQYYDFLSRYPDASGWDFWINTIASCGTDVQCVEVKRVNASGAFFLSIEFQQTGYLVERTYKTAYGDQAGTSTLGGSHNLSVPIVRLSEFLPDTQEIGQGVIVLQTGWEQQLENNKNAFMAEFVQRSRFITAFPSTMSAAQFVDTLNANAGSPLTTSERNQLVSDLISGAKTRAQVLRTLAEHPTLSTAEFNRAFVLMQYFGYLRRDPNSGQDRDFTGYDFWFTKLNQFKGDYIAAEMVKAFISSGEYRQRFGP